MQNQSRLGHTRFPALGAGYVYLLQVLIGSLWLALVIALVLVLQHSIENRSNYYNLTDNLMPDIIYKPKLEFVPRGNSQAFQ